MRVDALAQSPYPKPAKEPPGIALWCRDVRLRCVHWSHRRHSVRNGALLGYVRGWGENVWTPAPGDHYVIAVQPPQFDLNSLLRWCLKRWHIASDDEGLPL